MIAKGDEYTPTPALSRAILVYNRGRQSGLADGIVITPSHNPPADGGFKYNPTNGGPADTDVTNWIQDRANALLKAGNRDVKRLPCETAYTLRRGFPLNSSGFLAALVDIAPRAKIAQLRHA